jgi:hypothetical protein
MQYQGQWTYSVVMYQYGSASRIQESAGIVRLPSWVIGPCDGSGRSGSDVSEEDVGM